jgi:hypothetical protein
MQDLNQSLPLLGIRKGGQGTGPVRVKFLTDSSKAALTSESFQSVKILATARASWDGRMECIDPC